MKREISFSWTTGKPGDPRHFHLRLGEGVGETTLRLSEEEAKDLFDQMEAYRKEWQREQYEAEHGTPMGKHGIGLTKTEARDVFEVVSNEHLLDLEKHHLEPHVPKSLNEAQFKLQTFVWPGLCGPWGCHGEHGASDCNRALCDVCKIPFDECRCQGGAVLRVRNR